MSFFSKVIFVFILGYIELFLYPLPSAFIVLLLWSQFGSEKEALILAFLTGLLFDVVLLRTIGTTSLLFTTAIFIATLYKRKFQRENFFFLAVLSFGMLGFIEFTYRGSFSFFPLAAYTVLTLILARVLFVTVIPYEPWNRVS